MMTRVPDAAGPAVPPMLIDAWVPGANFINAHQIEIDAPPAAVWRAVRGIPSSIRPRGVAAVVGNALMGAAAVARGERWRWGWFDWAWSQAGLEDLRELIGTSGAELRVVEVEEGREVVLAGAHAYAAFATNFFLEPLPGGRTLVHNVSRAKFLDTMPARAYFAAVRVFHDPLMAWALAKLRRVTESPEIAARKR